MLVILHKNNSKWSREIDINGFASNRYYANRKEVKFWTVYYLKLNLTEDSV